MNIKEVLDLYNNELEGSVTVSIHENTADIADSKFKKITKDELLSALCYNCVIEEVLDQILYLRGEEKAK